MTFATVAASVELNNNSAVTTHTVPQGSVGTISAGDRLIVILNIDETFTSSGWPSGWSSRKQFQVTGNVMRLEVWEKIATGAESGDFTFTSSSACKTVGRLFRITGAHASTPISISTCVFQADSTYDPDSVTASWGSDDNLFIAFTASNTAAAPTGAPTNYTNLETGTNTGGQATGLGGYGVARRELAAASDDPGVFTGMGASPYGVAGTLVVRPAGAVPPSGPVLSIALGPPA